MLSRLDLEQDVLMGEFRMPQPQHMVHRNLERPSEESKVLPVSAHQRTELDLRLKAYEMDRNRGRPAVDVVADMRRRLQRRAR